MAEGPNIHRKIHVPPTDDDDTTKPDTAMSAAFEAAALRRHKNEKEPRPLGSGVTGPEDDQTPQSEAPDSWVEAHRNDIMKAIATDYELVHDAKMPEPEREQVRIKLRALEQARKEGGDVQPIIARLRSQTDTLTQAAAEIRKNLQEPLPIPLKRRKRTGAPSPAPTIDTATAPASSIDGVQGFDTLEEALAHVPQEPTPREPAPIDDERSDDAKLAAEMDKWRAAEEVRESGLPPVDTTPSENKKTLAELLAQFGQEGLESTYSDSSAMNLLEKEPKNNDEHPPRVMSDKELSETLGISGATEQERQAAQALGEGLKGNEALKKYFDERDKALNTKAKELGPAAEGLIYKVGDWYNKKVSFKQKLVIGAALFGTGLAFSTVSPLVMLAVGAGITAQRVLGGAGMYVKIENLLQSRAEKDTPTGRWLAEHPQLRTGAALLLGFGYSSELGHLMAYGIDKFDHTSWGEGLHGWLNDHWPFGYGEAQAVPPAGAGSAALTGDPVKFSLGDSTLDYKHITVPGLDDGQAPDLTPAPGGSLANPFDFHAGGVVGKGYEWDVEQLYKQIQHAKVGGFKLPDNVDPHSDIAEIYNAKPGEMTKVLQDIASRHGFYHPGAGHVEGVSDVIAKGSKFSIDSNGNVFFDQAGAGHPVVDATVEMGKHVTQPPHHEQLAQVRARLNANAAPHFPHGAPETQAAQAAEVAARHAGTSIASGNVPHPIPRPEISASAAAASGANPLEGMSSHAYMNQVGTPVDPDSPHGYMTSKGLYFFGGDKALDTAAQDFALKNHVSVFVDKSYSFLGIKVTRIVEYAPVNNDSAPAMVIHNDVAFAMDPKKDFTKPVF